MVRQLKRIGLFESYTLFESVGARIFLRERDQFRRDFDSRNATIRNTGSEAQARNPDAAPQLQNVIPGPGWNGGGKHHRIGAGPET